MSSNFQVQKDFIARMQEKKVGITSQRLKWKKNPNPNWKKYELVNLALVSGKFLDWAINYFWVFIKEFIISYIKIKLIFVFHKMAANLVKSFDLFCL